MSLSNKKGQIFLKNICPLNVSTTYQELLTRQRDQNLSSQERRKIKKEINSKFIDTEEDISATPKSKVVKDIICSLFPLSMKNAVQASREISAHINKKLHESNVDISKLNHAYDTIEGSLSDAKKFLKLENILIQQYKQYVLQNQEQNINYTTIVKNWFDININIDSCDVLITGSVDLTHALIG